jgi:polyphosphate kinase
MATSKSLNSSKYFINRELSWLEFNHRVLQMGRRDDVPLMERLMFLAIVSSNLDEFFMIRVAGLKQARAAGSRKKGPAGLTPTGQLRQIARRVRTMVAEQSQAIADVTDRLDEHDVHLLDRRQWSAPQKKFLADYFHRDVQPTLTPIALDRIHPVPLLPGLRLHLAVVLRDAEGDEHLAVVPVPHVLSRFVTIPAGQGLHLARVEDVIADQAAELFPGHQVLATDCFRLTRDNDVAVDTDDAGDFLQSIEEAIHQRVRRRVVRLELSARPDRRIKSALIDLFEIDSDDIVEVDGLLDAKALMDVASRGGQEDLKFEDWPAQPARDLLDSDDLLASLREHDVLLIHPYETFDPVVELVRTAASDPQVLAIKQTLYRTTGDSPIVAALQQAATSGKQVTVLVELKARFDEARNVGWAKVLEDAGADVIYGIAGLKTHAKMLLVIRREEFGIRKYLHLSTGNYNDKTAKLYSDIGLMTTDRELAADASAFFNLLTGYSQQVGWNKLTIAPTGLRQRIVELIDREAQTSSADQPGLIMAKMNSLQCPDIARALYRASQAGVKILLNIRGICVLQPGIEGVSKTIEVTSIIDRYLEHARIVYFRNGGHEEVYLSSADWMVRNLDKRLETLFPVTDANLSKRLISALRLYFSDHSNAWSLGDNGQWTPVESDGNRIRAQEILYREIVEDVKAARQTRLQFRPLTKQKGQSKSR